MYKRPLEQHLSRFSADPKQVLAPLLDQASAQLALGNPAVVVFDLDSTLFDLTARQMAIVEAFAVNQSSESAAVLKKIVVHPHDWGLDMAFRRAGHQPETMPLFKTLMHYWKDKFFSDAFLHHDQPHPGAPSFVQAFDILGAEIVYLSGRDIPRMLTGTIQSLRTHGFPLHHTNQVVLKPDARLNDVEFKLEFMRRLQREKSDAWMGFFDNEAANLNCIYHHLPQVNVVGFASTHSGHEEPHPQISFIDRWPV